MPDAGLFVRKSSSEFFKSVEVLQHCSSPTNMRNIGACYGWVKLVYKSGIRPPAAANSRRPGSTLSGALGKDCHVSDHDRTFLDAHDPQLLPYVQILVSGSRDPPTSSPVHVVIF